MWHCNDISSKANKIDQSFRIIDHLSFTSLSLSPFVYFFYSGRWIVRRVRSTFLNDRVFFSILLFSSSDSCKQVWPKMQAHNFCDWYWVGFERWSFCLPNIMMVMLSLHSQEWFDQKHFRVSWQIFKSYQGPNRKCIEVLYCFNTAIK